MSLRCKETETTANSATDHLNQTRQEEKMDSAVVCVCVCASYKKRRMILQALIQLSVSFIN